VFEYFSHLLYVLNRRSLFMYVVAHSNSKKRGSLESKHEAFSYTEILNITNNFKTTIGEGGFGKVYLGILQDNTRVAVKMLSPSSMQGYKEFQSEVRNCIQVRKQHIQF